ncbi:MAG: NUDIX domain-containing protein [Pseudomonadota bacterium]
MVQRLAVFIGRFQPFHNGHRAMVQTALAAADRVLVLIGSPDASLSLKNPFSADQRRNMIESVFSADIAADRLLIEPVPDTTYNENAWIADVQRIIERISAGEPVELCRVEAAGRTDAAGGPFSSWTPLVIESPFPDLDGTRLRTDYFADPSSLPPDACPEPVTGMLADYRATDAFGALVEEAEFLRRFRASWAQAPYEPIFTTVDALVVQSGHLLVIRRGRAPGKGLLALPGGFLDPNEPLRDAAIRELREETRISDRHGELSAEYLATHIRDAATKVFDAPYRSARGRTVTHCFLIRLPDSDPLYTVTGSDDAEAAHWIPLGALDPCDFFEDHYAIVQVMLGV